MESGLRQDGWNVNFEPSREDNIRDFKSKLDELLYELHYGSISEFVLASRKLEEVDVDFILNGDDHAYIINAVIHLSMNEYRQEQNS